MTESSRTGLAFRGDIEGLRAIAILLVVGAHAKLPWLAGGFVGVDVFFVLSGYLITGLLVREIDATGTVNLLDFYARRVRRLLPALLLVIACTVAAAALLLAPFEQPEQATAAASASVWLSNFHFAFAKLDYFGGAAESNLFLHTWSLGVEEQFYLVWPWLVLFLLGALRWQGSQLHHARLRNGLWAATLLCLALCVFLTWTQPAWAFYMMPARAWQFALGSLAGLALSCADAGRLHRFILSLGWVGLAIILASAFLLTPQTPYPGIAALLPSLGAAGVLLSGAMAPGGGIGRWLALPPMQTLGRISYGWYLWHWPVLLLGKSLVGQPHLWQVTTLVVLSLLLAMATYRWFESPIRRNPALIARPLANIAAGLLLMVSAWVFCRQAWQPAAMHWAQQDEQLQWQRARSDAPIIYGMGCDEWYHSANLRICAFGSPNASHTAMVIGDSVGLQWLPALTQTFNRPEWRLLVLTKSACPMVDAPFFYERIGRRYTECEAWRQSVLQTLPSLHPDMVVLGSSQSYPFTREQWIEGSRRVFASVGKATHGSVYVLQATPLLPFDGPSCLARQAWRPDWLRHADACTALVDTPGDRQIAGWLADAVAGLPRMKLIDLNDGVCPQGHCAALRDGVPVFRDSRHLSGSFAVRQGSNMARAIDLPAD